MTNSLELAKALFPSSLLHRTTMAVWTLLLSVWSRLVLRLNALIPVRQQSMGNIGR